MPLKVTLGVSCGVVCGDVAAATSPHRGCKIVAPMDGDKLPTSRPVRFTLGEVPYAYWVPKPAWKFWRRELCSCRDSNPDCPASRMVTVIENVFFFYTLV
jgi:hypothetical protein